VDELLQRHRSFTLSVAVGGLVFLVALLVRGCAVHTKDLGNATAVLKRKAGELTASPVPDDAHLARMTAVVDEADRRVSSLATEVGRTASGERLVEECLADILVTCGKDSPAERKRYLELARRLPSAAFTELTSMAREVLVGRAVQADCEIAQDDLGFPNASEADFTRNMVCLAAVVRIVDRAVVEGATRVDSISVPSGMDSVGGTEADPFLRGQAVTFRLRGAPSALAAVLRSLNEKDASGRRIVLDRLVTLGRPTTVRATEPATAEFTVRLLLVNLAAAEEEAP
jgi:hypothetical protein